MRRPSVDRPACCQHCGSEDLALMIGRFVYRSFASQRPLRWETLREAGGKGSAPAHREPAATPAPPPRRRGINFNPNPAPGPPPVVQTRPAPVSPMDPRPVQTHSAARPEPTAAGEGRVPARRGVDFDPVMREPRGGET